MTRQLIILGTLSLVLVSCSATYYAVAPINPMSRDPDRPAIVLDLQPLLQWRPTSEHDGEYDMIIYEGVEIQDLIGRYPPYWMPSREVYTRKGLREPQHLVEEQLRPDTVYFWSVRIRTATRDIGSGYVYRVFRCLGPYLCGVEEYSLPFFVFKTRGD